MLVTDPIIDSNVPRTISPGDLQPGAEVFYEDLLIVFVIVAEVRRYDKSAPKQRVFKSTTIPAMTLTSPMHEQVMLLSFLLHLHSFSMAAPSGWITFAYLEHARYFHGQRNTSIRSIIPGLSPSLHPGKYTSHLHGLYDRKTLDLEVVEKDFEVVERVKCTRKLQ